MSTSKAARAAASADIRSEADDADNESATLDVYHGGTASGDFYGYVTYGFNSYNADYANSGSTTYDDNVDWSYGVDTNGDGTVDTYTTYGETGNIDLYNGLITLSYNGETGAWSASVNRSAASAGLFANGNITTDIVVQGYIIANNGTATATTDTATIALTITCFTPGVHIRCPKGERLVETIKPGDLVTTAAGDVRQVRWVGHTVLDSDDLRADPKKRPVCIRKDSLGPGMPEADLVVSPQHRILLRSRIAERMFGVAEILVPAIKLVGYPGIQVDMDCSSVEYIHVLLDQHELLVSNGLISESLLWGKEVDTGLWHASYEEALSLFPELADPAFEMKSARLCVSNSAKIIHLMNRHKDNGKCLQEAS